MDTVMKLLDEIEEVLDSSRAVPFSSKVNVDKEEIYDIIAEIRTRLPNEIKQSKWVLEERNKILIDAKKEADAIVKSTQEQVAKLGEEHEITKQAYDRANEIIEDSKKTAKELRIGAIEYADEVLSMAEANLKTMLDSMHVENAKMEQFYEDKLNVIFENRNELRGIKK